MTANENLCTAISRRLEKIGFKEEDVANEYIHLNFLIYFLQKNLKSEYFLEENYEINTHPGKIVVDFKDELDNLVVETSCEEDNIYVEVRFKDKALVFSSSLNPLSIMITDGARGEIFKVDTLEASFTYYYKILESENIASEDLFCAKLTSINTKINNKEYFEYQRIYPKITYYNGMLDRIKKLRHRNKIIAILKGKEDASIYDDVLEIFNELRKECVLALKTTDDEKKLRKQYQDE